MKKYFLKKETSVQTLEEKFTKAIIIADCKLFLAILTFIRQEVSAYLSSGLLQIRRSWKMYSRIQKQLFELYKKLDSSAEEIYGTSTNCLQLWLDDNEDTINNNEATKNDSIEGLNELTIEDDEISSNGITLDAVKRY